MLKENGEPPREGKWADIAVLSRCANTRRGTPPRCRDIDAVVDAIGQIESKVNRNSTKAAAE